MEQRRESERTVYALWGVLLLCGLIVFQFFGNSVRVDQFAHSLFHWWVAPWFDPGSETEHGPIILLLAGWLFVRNVKRSAKEENRPGMGLGLGLIAFGFLLHFAGYMAQQTRLSILGFLVFVVGSAYVAGGRRWGRAVTFPCILMVFSIHWAVITDEIGFTLRLAVIKASYALARMTGIEVIRSGTQLFAPDGSFNYDVAPACSGIRSLLALSSLSLVLGYLSFRSFWRRSLLLALSFPYAFLGNVIRIYSIVLAAEWFGEAAGSIVHKWFGFLIFIIVLGLAMLTVELLERFLPEKETVSPEAGVEKETSGPVLSLDAAIAPRERFIYGGWILLLSLLVAFSTREVDRIGVDNRCGVMLAANQVDPRKLPVMLSLDWAGQDVAVTEVERRILPKDTGFSRKNYVNLLDPGKRVLLSIVLSGRDRSSIHRPEVCLVAQGWTIKGKRLHDFSLPVMKGGELTATVLEIERTLTDSKGGERVLPALFAYWFISGENTVPSHYGRLLQVTIDRLFHFKNHRWAYVVAQTLSPDGEEAGMKRIEAVLQEAVPQFQTVGLVRKFHGGAEPQPK